MIPSSYRTFSRRRRKPRARATTSAPEQVPAVVRAYRVYRTTVHARCPHCRRRHVVPLTADLDVSEPFVCPDNPHAAPLVAVKYRNQEL